MRGRIERLLVLIVITGAACSTMADSADTLQGVWRVTEIAAKGKSSSAITNPLPGLAIFTQNHYSLVWMPGEQAQRAFATRWQPTDAEKIERYGSTVVNSGEYQIAENVLMLVARQRHSDIWVV
jgi:hypothetical protein